MLRWISRIAMVLAIGLAGAWLAALVVLFVFQRDFQYDRGGRMFTLDETLLTGAEEVRIPVGEATVTGWYQAPEPGRPLIIYYRGNAQSFSREHPRYEAFVAAGYGFLAIDYRGFPGSPGELSEASVLADALAAYDWAAEKGFPMLIWGRSLGSGPASYVASRRDAEAVLLETPFVSAVAVAAERYGFLPVGLLMHDQYRVDTWIADVAEPVMVAHGTADITIAVRHGEDVYRLAPNPVTLWIEPGAGHADLWDRGLWGRAQAFLADVLRP